MRSRINKFQRHEPSNKREIFKKIGPIELIYRPITEYPFVGYWETPSGRVVGMKIECYQRDSTNLITKHYLLKV